MLRAATGLVAAGLTLPTLAEVATDGSAGGRIVLAGPEFAIGAGLGTRAGRNLFHSFETFSLADGERATFSGPGDIRRIISRVTGGERSDIDGTLRSTIPGADFYFINPAGIVFGPNASLDLQGSFHVSTADELRFADGTKFSATNPNTSSFTIAAPEAFGFLGAHVPAPISVDQSILEVPAGKSLSIVGGDIDIAGGPAGFIRARAGQITLAAVGGPGAARLESGTIDAARRARISLTDQAAVAVNGDGGGTIRIRGGRVVVDASGVVADNNGSRDSSGSLDVEADALLLRNGSLLTADVVAGGTGSGGLVRVRTARLQVDDGSAISSSTFADGDAGGVVVAADRLTVDGGRADGFTGIVSQAVAGSSGDAGKVKVTSGSLLVVNGGAIAASTFASGNAGGVAVKADELVIAGGSEIDSSSTSSGAGGTVEIKADALTIRDGGTIRSATLAEAAAGDAGVILIRAGALAIAEGGVIISSTAGDGTAGRITIAAKELTIDGAGGIASGAGQASSGDAGRVDVTADALAILNGGRISSATRGEGDAGAVRIDVTGTFLLDSGGAINNSSALGAVGAGGRVDISTGSMKIGTNSGIITSVSGPKAAGPVTIDVTDGSLLIDGGFVESATFGPGASGAIDIKASGDISLIDSRIENSARAFLGGPTGPAGSITIETGGDLQMLRSRIATVSDDTGGGQINVNAADRIQLTDSLITSEVFGGADTTAGDITIDPRFIILDGSRIVAKATEGEGGAIDITVDQLISSPDSVIDASSDTGIDGTVVISAPEVDLSGGLVVLEGAFLDQAPLRARCGARADIGASSFTGVGRAGLPPSPDGPLAGSYARAEVAAAAGPTPAAAGGAAGGVLLCAPRS